MAKKFGFFNSINGDRKYLASDLSQAFDIGITTGLKQEEGNLEVVPYQGMQVQIQPGSAMIHGHFYINDEAEIITLDVADPELGRIDRVVLRFDAYAREINTAVIKGTPGVNPVPPARLETKEQFDLVLADIYIPAAATEITPSNITDMRYSELCGYIGVKGAVSQLQFDAHLSSGKHITESGENSNGRYIKFDDGTIICYMTKPINYQTEVQNISFVYPAAIKSYATRRQANKNVSFSISSTTAYEGPGLELSVDNPLITSFNVTHREDGTGCTVRVAYDRGSFASREVDLMVTVIGRWK